MGQTTLESVGCRGCEMSSGIEIRKNERNLFRNSTPSRWDFVQFISALLYSDGDHSLEVGHFGPAFLVSVHKYAVCVIVYRDSLHFNCT